MRDSLSLSTRSEISTCAMEDILDKLKTLRNRDSMRINYHSIWKQFNTFILKLDFVPKFWEDRISLFATHLVHIGSKSTTVKSYVSGIKSVLRDDGYCLNEDRVMLNALTRACKIRSDRVTAKLPIKLKLLEVLIFEANICFAQQPFLCTLYKAILALGYYGLMRVGELACGDHVIKASNIHMGTNKKKILIVLFTSKTHDLSMKPQKVKIQEMKNFSAKIRHFCPFQLVHDYITSRGRYKDLNEQFFIFRDGSPVKSSHISNMLRSLLKAVGINSSLYGFHSLRAGRATDLLNWGYSLEQIKLLGRWRSNAIYKYLKY